MNALIQIIEAEKPSFIALQENLAHLEKCFRDHDYIKYNHTPLSAHRPQE